MTTEQAPSELTDKQIDEIPAAASAGASERIMRLADAYARSYKPELKFGNEYRESRRELESALRAALQSPPVQAVAVVRDDFSKSDMRILRAALALYSRDSDQPAEIRSRAYAMFQVLRMEDALQSPPVATAQQSEAPLPPNLAWRDHQAAIDSKALATATEIALMWGQDRSQFVSRIQVAVTDAMLWLKGALPGPAPIARAPFPTGAAVIHPGMTGAGSISSCGCYSMTDGFGNVAEFKCEAHAAPAHPAAGEATERGAG